MSATTPEAKADLWDAYMDRDLVRPANGRPAPCLLCDGDGMDRHDEWQDCRRCHGSGIEPDRSA